MADDVFLARYTGEPAREARRLANLDLAFVDALRRAGCQLQDDVEAPVLDAIERTAMWVLSDLEDRANQRPTKPPPKPPRKDAP